MSRGGLTAMNKNRLRLWLSAFFALLAAPTAVLVFEAYDRLKWESFHQSRVLAEEVSARIDARLENIISKEEQRSFSDYSFLTVEGSESANFVQRSELSTVPPLDNVPGTVGYFQVDAGGRLTTPHLPTQPDSGQSPGLEEKERRRRQALFSSLESILRDNKLVHDQRLEQRLEPKDLRAGEHSDGALAAAPAERKMLMQEIASAPPDLPEAGRLATQSSISPPKGLGGPTHYPAEVEVQTNFDQLNEGRKFKQQRSVESAGRLGRLADLKLESRYAAKPAAPRRAAPQAQDNVAGLKKRISRKELAALPEPVQFAQGRSTGTPAVPRALVRVRAFESEIDPFEFSLLDSGHFVLFRKVWRNGQRFVQGLLIEQQPFLRGIVEKEFRSSLLSRSTDLVVAFQGDVLLAISAGVSRRYFSSTEDLEGALLLRTRLSAPANEIEVVFSLKSLPVGPGGAVIVWVSVILFLVLCVGFYLMYRVGLRQLSLVRQQQDFVSAVSHELKTPLTSIRMYGEMLRAGWVEESKRKSYYDFIFTESERLSRLINNVLQLARMTRSELTINPRVVPVAELVDELRAKVTSQAESAGYELNVVVSDRVQGKHVKVDVDYLSQIIINLVDNAIKFSTKAKQRQLDIDCRLEGQGLVALCVRDYGPGIAQQQMKKIFKLFYRSENELTRETVGTGIGLALVNELTLAMSGRVDVVNRQPGAEFRILLPTA